MVTLVPTPTQSEVMRPGIGAPSVLRRLEPQPEPAEDEPHPAQRFLRVPFRPAEYDKVIAVATNDPEFSGYVEAHDLPPHRLLVLKRFFQDYKQLEGKRVEVEDIRPAYAAVTVIERALARYQQERKKLIAKEGR